MDECERIHVFVFLGYGAFHTPDPIMAAHLNEAISLCNRQRPEIIVATGGCSRMKTMPGRSEAWSILEYVKPRLAYKPFFVSEDEALLTLDNIRNTKTELESLGYEREKMLVTFWCDPTRRRTIKLIGKPIFGDALRVRTSGVKVVQDPLVMNLAAMAANWASSKSSFVYDHLRASRQKKFAES